MSVLKRASRWAVGLGPMIAALTAHGVTMLLVLALLVLALAVLGRGMMRWVISDEERSDRAIRLLLAWRGKARPPVPGRQPSTVVERKSGGGLGSVAVEFRPEESPRSLRVDGVVDSTTCGGAPTGRLVS